MARSDDSMSPGRRTTMTFRDRLNELFAQREAATGRTVSNAAVARWMNEHGYSIAASYLPRLRREGDLSPSLRIIEGLAAYFGVDSSRLLSQDEAAAELHKILDDRNVRGIALRAAGLSVENISAIRDLVDRLRSEQGLPDVRNDANLDE